MYKKINVYQNGKYIYSTTQFKTCREAVEDCKRRKEIKVMSIPDYIITINDDDKITASFK